MTAGVTLEDVLVPQPDVHVVALGDEKVIFVPRDETLQRLDPLASIVWDCLLPAAPLADIATDLAEAFGADRQQVSTDLLRLAADLLDSGALVRAGDAAELPPDA